MERKYLIVIETGEDGSYSAYVPDLPGCVSCADSVADLKKNIREAIEMYLEDLLADGEQIPEPSAQCTEMAIAV